MNILKKKNKASFVFFIITLYSFIGFGLGLRDLGILLKA